MEGEIELTLGLSHHCGMTCHVSITIIVHFAMFLQRGHSRSTEIVPGAWARARPTPRGRWQDYRQRQDNVPCNNEIIAIAHPPNGLDDLRLVIFDYFDPLEALLPEMSATGET